MRIINRHVRPELNTIPLKFVWSINKISVIAIMQWLFLMGSFSFSGHASEVSIIDASHYSSVFGEMRNYRIFLPPDYFEQTGKRYPVIYYYHGWSQRYFGSTNHAAVGVDKGTDNEGDNIESFVSSHEVIVVKPDGYNRRPEEPYYLRPYNISPVETDRQFPLYFPELVQHIDGNYRTIADRNHRAISGLSMGGFMTFWIAGKYPHLVSAAGNFCGSTEFFVGPKDMPVEYRHIDMHKNYQGLNVRLHYGDKDFIRGYHQDLNRVWPQVMDNYHFEVFDAEHTTCGLGKMFQFIVETFKDPLPRPGKWHHTDVYPSFSVWDYQVQSDRDLPGFTVLENVNRSGFRCTVREFLPDGPLMSYVQLTVQTPPLYQPNQPYTIVDVDPKGKKEKSFRVISDDKGSLKISINGGYHEIGINKAEDPPNVTFTRFAADNSSWALKNEDVQLSVSLLNKGASVANGVQARLVPSRKSTIIKQGQAEFGAISVGEIRESSQPFVFRVNSDSLIDVVQFKLAISDEIGNQWEEFFEIPVRTDPPLIESYEIADGRQFRVAMAGNDSIDTLLGNGNGDGIANPGETVVVLIKDQGIYHRAYLDIEDNYVNPKGINIRKSDNWGSYDHVGGSAKYSEFVIASSCPENHTITAFSEYWLPDYPYHLIQKGKVNLTVSGKDNTPPVVRWIKVSSDNTLQASLYDGGEIKSVVAKLKSEENADQLLQITLVDNGDNGDRTSHDGVFSFQIPEQKFGLYNVEIEAKDIFDNVMTINWPGSFVVY